MAAKKKASAKKPRTPRVDGTKRTHRAIDAQAEREAVKSRAIAEQEVVGDDKVRQLPEAIVDDDGVTRSGGVFGGDDAA